MKEETRPLPGNPAYHLSKSGRLYGPISQIRPEYDKRYSTQNAKYKICIGITRKRLDISTIMHRVWGIEFATTPQWVEEIRAECEHKPLGKRKRAAPINAEEIPCAICEELFAPRDANQNVCTKESCQKERVRRCNNAARRRRKLDAAIKAAQEAARGQECQPPNIKPSFSCPFVDHFDSEGHFEQRMKTDLGDFTHAQNDPFGRYGDYDHHAVMVNKPQQERIAA